jgi:hypothetical protein
MKYVKKAYNENFAMCGAAFKKIINMLWHYIQILWTAGVATNEASEAYWNRVPTQLVQKALKNVCSISH